MVAKSQKMCSVNNNAHFIIFETSVPSLLNDKVEVDGFFSQICAISILILFENGPR